MRFWFVVAILESRTCAKNMGHAERDQQIAKRTIYSSKTKWAKSKGEPESLFPSPSILFSRETKRNETKLIPSMTGRKKKKNQVRRHSTPFYRWTLLTRPYPFSFFIFLFFFIFQPLHFCPAALVSSRTKQGFSIVVKKKKEEKERKKEEREKNRGKDATLDRASATRVAFSKSVMDGLMAPFGECVFAGKSLKLRSLFRPDAVNSRPFSCFSNRFLFFFSLLIHFERQFPPPPDFFNEMIHKSV